MGGTGELFSKIVNELASLPDTSDIAARRGLLAELDYPSLAMEIDMTGSDVAFFQRLLLQLSYGDDTAVPEFLQRVSSSPSIGVDRARVFMDLSDELLALDPVIRCALFAPGNRLVRLPAEFQAATRRGIAELGSKYISDLYFRREEIEDRFDEFLGSNATCFLVVSKPGMGKTNFLCNIAHRLYNKRNILFLTARAPLAGPHGLLETVSSWLGYGADWFACFADMKRLRQSCLILLDAINESAASPEILKEALQYLLREAERAEVKVVVTCRTDFWQFYRAPFWANYIWVSAGGGTEWTRSFARGQDLPLFALEQFDEIVTAYFRTFQVDGRLAGEAADRCRHPLMLRIFCEAYAARSVGVVTELRLYRLLKEFWARKIEHVAEVWNLRQTDAVARLVLIVAGLMRQRQSTSVPREEVARALAATPVELDSSSSLYSRVLDEEIILEENVDEDAGIRNVIFVYDRFSEYAIALSFYTTEQWHSKSAREILLDTGELMRRERTFGTLRGALEFLVQRLEDRRPADEIQFAMLGEMIKNDWKWRRIGTVLTFQLDPELSGPAFWDFVWKLAESDIVFIRRMVASQVGLQVHRSPERVLAVLNRLRADPVDSVRNAAVQAMFSLPVQVVIQEIEQLARAAQGQMLAAELLLWPRDWTSLTLRRKLEWLTGAGRDVIPDQVIMRVLDAGASSELDDLFGQEELASAMFELEKDLKKTRPNSIEMAEAAAWKEKLEKMRDRSRATLQNDLAVLERTFVLTDQALELAKNLDAKEGKPLTPLHELIPDRYARSRFFSQFTGGREMDNSPSSRNCFLMAAEVARSEPLPHPEAGVRFAGSMGYFSRALDDADVFRLQGIMQNVCERARNSSRWGRSEPRLTTALDAGGLNLDRGALLEFQQEVLDEYGVIASPVDLRNLTTIGRLVLWIDDRLQQQQQHESRLLRLREEIKALDMPKLRDRIAAFQHPLPTAEQRAELGDELLVLGRIYGDRQDLLADLLAPLIIWHDDQDSELLAELINQIYERDPSAFWLLTQALLTHPDQRVIDLASAAMERAEYAERQNPAGVGILAGLGEIIEEIAGVPADEVRMDASFVDDLDIDSLSMVEIAVAAQDKFGVEIPDENLKDLSTVRQVVEFVQAVEQSRSQTSRPRARGR